MESIEFHALLEFLDKQYNIKREEAEAFIEHIELKKDILDFRQSEYLFDDACKRDF
jgi:hypothetical protein